MDAALLAAATPLTAGQRAMELGCGAGGALLQAAARCPEASFVGVERDPAALTLAKTNITLNDRGGHVQVMAGTVAGGFKSLGLERFDLTFANPPFFDDPATLRAPMPERTGAWMAEDGLEAWVTFLVEATKLGGSVVIIHRADRLADLLAGLQPLAGSVRVRPIHPFVDEPAKRVIVQAVKGGRAPLALLPALVLHDRSGAKHTAEAESIFKGETALRWS